MPGTGGRRIGHSAHYDLQGRVADLEEHVRALEARLNAPAEAEGRLVPVESSRDFPGPLLVGAEEVPNE